MHPNAKGKIWYPAECDVSIRPGWFWHADQDDKVKSLEHLVDIYFKSVGRNSVLLLNVPPNNRGLFADPDVKRLGEFRKFLDQTFSIDLAQGKNVKANSFQDGHPAANAIDGDKNTYWAPKNTSGILEVDLGEPLTFNVSMIMEYIALSQRVEEYSIEVFNGSEWKTIVNGTTIGHKKLDRFDDIKASKIRLNIKRSSDVPLIRSFGLFKMQKINT